MVIAVPVVEHIFIQFLGTHKTGHPQFAKKFTGKRKITTIDLAEQILTCHRHVFRIGGPQVVVTLVGAGAAFDANI